MKLKIIIVSLLLLIGLTIFGFAINEFTKQEGFNYNNVTLSQEDYNAIKQTFGDNYSVVRVCNLEKGNCILLGNIENIKKSQGK